MAGEQGGSRGSVPARDRTGTELAAAGGKRDRVGRDCIRVRVRYPPGPGEIVLRTELDWERDVAPLAVSEDRTTFDFELRTAAPFLYFKPVLCRGAERRWAIGANCLAVRGAPAPREVYPTFYDDSGCSHCELRELCCEETGATHAYRIFFPPGYGENVLRRYPVLYMQDGQNLFFPGEAFGGEHWRVAETLGILDEMNAAEKVIVVGVYPNDREREYTLPGYGPYGRFLVHALKPRVDAEARTLAGARQTAVMGSSLGGVASFYLAWEWPDVFGSAACLSSTFGWRDDLRGRVEREEKRPVRYYLDSGWPRDNYEVTRDMRAVLRSRGYREGEDLLYFAFPQARHDEHSWAMRSHIPYQFFFGRGAGAA